MCREIKRLTIFGLQVPSRQHPGARGEQHSRNVEGLPVEANDAVLDNLGRVGVGDRRREEADQLQFCTVRCVVQGFGD